MLVTNHIFLLKHCALHCRYFEKNVGVAMAFLMNASVCCVCQSVFLGCEPCPLVALQGTCPFFSLSNTKLYSSHACLIKKCLLLVGGVDAEHSSL